MKKSVLTVLMLSLGINFMSYAQKINEQYLDSIISLLSLDEKINLIHAQSKFSVKGVDRLGIPELWMSDGPHGVRGEINWDNWGYAGWTNDYITAFPALTALSSTFNPDLAYEYGKALGEEALYREKDVLLGPGVNIYRTPLNGRNFEYMGEDPYLASQFVVPYIKGVQSNGVAACVKHYVLNNQELDRGIINVQVSERALREIYLPAFKAAVHEGNVWSIMGAYNRYLNQFCSHNEKLNDILKNEWAFDGAMITDWGAAHSTSQAAKYGLDIEMGTATNGLTSSTAYAYDYYYLASPYKQALKSGELSTEDLDDKVKRVLRLIMRTSMNDNRGYGVANNDQHLKTALKIAEEGIVLLKNEQEFFPIQDKKGIKIAVIGENATKQMTLGGGSSELKAKDEISPLRGLEEHYLNSEILYSMGYSSGPSVYEKILPPKENQDSLFQSALETAKRADIILFIGGLNKNHQQDCEGGDRQSYELPFNQVKLIKALSSINSNIGVVLISGNAVQTDFSSEIKGLIQAWYLGSQAGPALANIISGKQNPSGKLPFSFPEKLEDNPAHYFGAISYPGDGDQQIYQEDILVGYRWHDTKKIEAKYAFGYGLSYTSFKIDKARLSQSENELKIDYKIKNTGDIQGAEVVQFYVGKINSAVSRAKKELKAFQKIDLEPKQEKTGQVIIDLKDLRYFDEKTKSWVLEKGLYRLYIGNSSDNIIQTIDFRLD